MSKFPKTCQLIAEAGINPDDVMIDGLDTTGYNAPILAENGKRIIRQAEDGPMIVVERVPWPSPEIGLRVIDQWLQEGGRQP